MSSPSSDYSEKTHILDPGQVHGADITDDTAQLVGDDEGRRKDKITSSIPLTSFNFINSIIGSGIIGMPFALKQAGIGLGLILMIVVAVVTDYSVVLLIKSGTISGTNSYQGLVRAAFGTPGFYVLSIMQFLYPFIAMISYNVIIGDVFTKVLLRITRLPKSSIIGNRDFIIALGTLLFTLPLSLYRNIAKLGKISFISVLFTAFIMVVILIRLATLGPTIPATPGAWNFADKGVTSAVAIMAFAFMCHHNSFLIYDSLENPTLPRWNVVTHVSVIVALVASIIFGVGGYVTFTEYTEGDIFENYCDHDDLVNAARFLFGVTIVLTYPIECFVTREVIENVFFSSHQPQPLLRHLAETSVLVIATLAISLATDCLGIVLELNGVLGAAPLAFILPALCYIKVEEGSILSFRKLPALLTALFGFTVAISGLVMAIYYAAESSECSHGEEKWYCKVHNITTPLVSTMSSVITSRPVLIS